MSTRSQQRGMQGDCLRMLALFALAVLVWASTSAPGFAQQDTATNFGAGEQRLVYLAADPAEGLPGPVTGTLEILVFDQLPEADRGAVDVLSAMLRSAPVSTFATGSDGVAARIGDLHLVVDLTLSEDAGTVMAAIGPEVLSLNALDARLSGLVDALQSGTRQMAHFRIYDPDDVFPRALLALRRAAESLDFAALILSVDRDPVCEAGRTPLHMAVLAGVPDRPPFGSGDGIISRAEAMAYLEDALRRGVRRAAECAADYSLIFASDGPGLASLPVSTVPAAPLIAALDEAVYLESFAALFLLSADDEAAIGNYLATCVYCPSERDLQSRLQGIGQQARALALETEVWTEIQNDPRPARIEVYLDHCQLCAFGDAARGRLTTLAVAEQARAAELVALAALMATDDLEGLRRWLLNCEACEGRDGATARILALEADGRYLLEAETLQTALRLRNTDSIGQWLVSCELCAAREEAEATLAAILGETTAAAPCVAAAGLPQQGGPRLLTEIDQQTATEICDAVLSSYPASALAATIRGRVALAAGDTAAAEAGYIVGMDAGLPQAFGLAAHNVYAPLDVGVEPDFALAETFALRGFEAGDWFSGEVLVVLYSRELMPGKTASDAFGIALVQAQDGNPVAQFFAGFFLSTGTGTAPDQAEAVGWYEAAVAQGYAHAAAFLADILEVGAEAEGETPAIPADSGRAAQIYLDALAAGDPTALERLTTQLRDRPREVVREVQTRLRDAGVFTSIIDGIGGPATARAVTAYYELNQPDTDPDDT